MTFLAGIVAFLVALWAWFWPICSTIIVIVGSIWGVFKAWPSLRRAFQVGDTVAALPEQLKEIKTQLQTLEDKSDRKEKKLEQIEADVSGVNEKLQQHLEDSKAADDEYNTLKPKLEQLVGELAHNGGSSIKDAVARLELKANDFDQLPGESLEAAVKRMRNVLQANTAPVLAHPLDTPE